MTPVEYLKEINRVKPTERDREAAKKALKFIWLKITLIDTVALAIAAARMEGREEAVSRE